MRLGAFARAMQVRARVQQSRKLARHIAAQRRAMEQVEAASRDGRLSAVVVGAAGPTPPRTEAALAAEAAEFLADLRADVAASEQRLRACDGFECDADRAIAAAAGEFAAAPFCDRDAVPYLSHQNNNLREQFPRLSALVPPSPRFAVAAFGNEAEAVNLWIGDEGSFTTLHKDHYENVYCVLAGEKQFLLFPPSDALYLKERRAPSARFERVAAGDAAVESSSAGKLVARQDGFNVIVDAPERLVPWIEPGYDSLDVKSHPALKLCSPIRVSVRKGDLLYLPSLWYHAVSQSCGTVAVNYWHDMDFGHTYCMYTFLRSVSRSLALSEDAIGRIAGADSHDADADADEVREEEAPLVEHPAGR